MKNLKRINLTFSMLFNLLSPSLPQGFNYAGPEDDRYLFVIGWSNDGRRFAYGTYNDFQSPVSDERLCSIAVIILDLVKDSTITVIARDWSSSNSDFPESSRQAWMYFDQSSNINEQITFHGIAVSAPDAISWEVSGNRIFLENDLLTFDVSVFESENRYSKNYEVHVTSENLGEKMITGGEIPLYREGVALKGYVLNPDRSRAALFFSIYGGAEYDDEYFIVGCHLKAGFITTRK